MQRVVMVLNDRWTRVREDTCGGVWCVHGSCCKYCGVVYSWVMLTGVEDFSRMKMRNGILRYDRRNEKVGFIYDFVAVYIGRREKHIFSPSCQKVLISTLVAADMADVRQCSSADVKARQQAHCWRTRHVAGPCHNSRSVSPARGARRSASR